MKPLPVLCSDEEAEAFVADADLTDYDLSEMVAVRFERRAACRMLRFRLKLACADARAPTPQH